jgi:hypothetical protein
MVHDEKKATEINSHLTQKRFLKETTPKLIPPQLAAWFTCAVMTVSFLRQDTKYHSIQPHSERWFTGF